MAKKNAPVSQSRTMWVKKGDIVGGKEVKKGYLAQYGRPEKRVTARVKIETATESGKKAGEVYRYKAGRTVKPSEKAKTVKPRSMSDTSKPKPTPPPSNYKTAARMGKPGEYQAGAGMRSRPAVAGSVRQRQAKQSIQMTPERNPYSLVGGSVAIANMTKRQAMRILREVEKGNRKISATNKRLLEKYVQGTK